ncbi:IclR family transcriptional regulator [Vibrio algarum]|uniref:IclR family transcriptional regulator C-terminal domain-containing protein n=1 Tax=Vibrio algarum TaxID=3020714 RepID=A0ABT4YVL5_9VIBR|nr:IclR family transcriptional regulator C-terminal domain-containing protein [Vibrio sp. KJ40-1]MDB1125196.1 IclR family transcriptional regulator C-terminal domain-containing protein [Vibrio sp. KJ40-1]
MSNTNDKVFIILSQVATYGKPVSVKRLSKDLNMPLSSLYRYITLLKDWLLLEENLSTREIYIGSMSLTLASNHERAKLENSEYQKALERLSNVTGETCMFMVPAGYHALCTLCRESSEALRCSFEVGQTQPLIKGASSKVLLANLPKERQKKVAKYYGLNFHDLQWQQSLSKTRRDGFSISTSDYYAGVVGVSVPIIRKKHLCGAITIMAPSERAKKGFERVIQDLMNEASILCGSR